MIGIFSLVSRCRSLDHCHSQIRQLFNSLKTFSDSHAYHLENGGPSQLPCPLQSVLSRSEYRFLIYTIRVKSSLRLTVSGLWTFRSGSSRSDTFLRGDFPHHHSDSQSPDSHEAVGGSLLFFCSSPMMLPGLGLNSQTPIRQHSVLRNALSYAHHQSFDLQGTDGDVLSQPGLALNITGLETQGFRCPVDGDQAKVFTHVEAAWEAVLVDRFGP